jgi:hypothetical protein
MDQKKAYLGEHTSKWKAIHSKPIPNDAPHTPQSRPHGVRNHTPLTPPSPTSLGSPLRPHLHRPIHSLLILPGRRKPILRLHRVPHRSHWLQRLSCQHKHHLVPLLRCYHSQCIRSTLQVSDPGLQQPHFRRETVLPQISNGRGISELCLSVRCQIRRELLCAHGNEGADTGGILAPEFALLSSTSLCKFFSIDEFWTNGHRGCYVCSS